MEQRKIHIDNLYRDKQEPLASLPAGSWELMDRRLEAERPASNSRRWLWYMLMVALLLLFGYVVLRSMHSGDAERPEQEQGTGKQTPDPFSGAGIPVAGETVSRTTRVGAEPESDKGLGPSRQGAVGSASAQAKQMTNSPSNDTDVQEAKSRNAVSRPVLPAAITSLKPQRPGPEPGGVNGSKTLESTPDNGEKASQKLPKESLAAVPAIDAGLLRGGLAEDAQPNRARSRALPRDLAALNIEQEPLADSALALASAEEPGEVRKAEAAQPDTVMAAIAPPAAPAGQLVSAVEPAGGEKAHRMDGQTQSAETPPAQSRRRQRRQKRAETEGVDATVKARAAQPVTQAPGASQPAGVILPGAVHDAIKAAGKDSAEAPAAAAAGRGLLTQPVPVLDTPSFSAARLKRLELGVKAGYERGLQDNPINKFVVAPYFQYYLSERLSLAFQPAIRWGNAPALAKEGTQAYYRHTGTSIDTMIAPGTITAILTYHHRYDSILVSQRSERRVQEFEFPLLLQYHLRNGLAFTAGASLTTGRMVAVTEQQEQHTGLEQTDTFHVTLNVISPPPDTSRSFVHIVPSYVAYTPGDHQPALNPLRVGYVLGIQYNYKNWMGALTLQQTLSGLSEVKNKTILEGYRQPYLRILLGYRIRR